MPEILRDDLRGPEVAAFLEQHLADMRAVSPPESKHALDLAGLCADGVSFWSLRDGNAVVGCVALQELDRRRAELKSMRVDARRRGGGLGARLLQYAIEEARRRGYRELLLETGSMDYFLPARTLYERFGFTHCGPFGKYVSDPNSVFMRIALDENETGRHE